MNVADSADDAREFVAEYGWSFPSIEDPDRRLARKVGASYQPVHALLDPWGRLLARSLSGKPSEWEAMLELLQPATPTA